MPPYQNRQKFPPWVPDISDQMPDVSADVQNVVPRNDGWGPFPSFQAFSQSLPAPCRGFFYAKNPDGSIATFAGTAASKLYSLNNNTLTWTDVSQGGATYTALPVTGQWSFVQFNNTVVACQANANPQAINLPVGGNFADLGGTPPQAAFVSVVNRFLFLSGITAQPYRIQWSDLDNITTWTAGVGQADFQDLPDGGLCRGIAGFDLYAVVFQTSMARLLTYAPGSPLVFTITKITGGDGNGLFADYGWVIDQDNVFWISQEGFKMLPPGGGPTPIGKEMVDRYFFNNVDAGNLQLCIATTDPAVSRIYVAFKSVAGQAGLWDTILTYDWRLQRWSRTFQMGQYLTVFSRPGLTEEQLDPLTPGSVSITGAASGTGGVIRLTVSPGTSGLTAPLQNNLAGVQTFKWNVTQIVGTAPFLAAINNTQNNANSAWGSWPISIFDGTHVELTGSVFAGAYTSGGFLGANEELIPFSFDTVSTSSLPSLAAFNGNNVLGFYNGPPLQAIIETGEQGTQEQRLFVKGFRVICDAPTILGSVSYRDNAQAPYNYTGEVGLDGFTGTILVAGGGIDTRYTRAKIRIPAGIAWTFAMAVEPDVDLTGTY